MNRRFSCAWLLPRLGAIFAIAAFFGACSSHEVDELLFEADLPAGEMGVVLGQVDLKAGAVFVVGVEDPPIIDAAGFIDARLEGELRPVAGGRPIPFKVNTMAYTEQVQDPPPNAVFREFWGDRITEHIAWFCQEVPAKDGIYQVVLTSQSYEPKPADGTYLAIATLADRSAYSWFSYNIGFATLLAVAIVVGGVVAGIVVYLRRRSDQRALW